MNKQELIKTLEELKNNIPNIEVTDVHDDYLLGKKTVYINAIGLAKQLDEPQQPVVPQFVADWFEDNEDYLDNNIWQYVYGWDDQEHGNEFFEWFANCDKPIETIIRMKDGYDVEKEPSYCVKIGKGYFSGFDETKVTYVLDDAPGSLARRVTYKDKNEAEMDALQIGGIVEEVAEG